MSALQTLSDSDLLARLPAVVRTERMATANVIEHLAEVDRRRLYLQAACPSLNQYCIERLGYSKEAAYKRARVARLVQRVPAALTELESGAIHLTGLSVIADHLTPENQNELLPACRGRTRGQIERLIASCFSEDLLLDRIEAAPGASGVLGTPAANTAAAPSAGPSPTGGMAHPPPRPLPARITPVSSTHDRIEFVASAALRDKIERAQRLLSHAVPSGDLAVLLERALDELIAAEEKRRFGAGRARKARAQKAGARHVPVAVRRAVFERDGQRCTFVDAEGHRCSATRFLTIEHQRPFANGGAATVENLCVLCSAHNAESARRHFGSSRIEYEIAKRRRRSARKTLPEPGPSASSPTPTTSRVTTAPAAHGASKSAAPTDIAAKIHRGLVNLGFRDRPARDAVQRAIANGCEPVPETLLRAALTLLTARA